MYYQGLRILRVLKEKMEKNGETGPANTLTIGTVEKGTKPSATITGDAPNQILNLVLPTGETAEIEALKAKHAQEISALENLIPTGQASGESITINDSAEYKFKKFGVGGNSKQETRSGKNLFDASKISNSKIIVSDNGKTITMPIFTTGNGSETSGSTLKRLCPNLSIGDVVFLKFDRNLGITYNNFIYLTKTQEQWANGSSKTITQEMLDSVVILYGNRYTSGETGQCILTNFRIVKNADDEWEQYGASPSPEFPSEIKNVTGNVKVKVEGKNRFDKSIYTNSIYNGYFLKNILKVGQNYTISFKNIENKTYGFLIKSRAGAAMISDMFEKFSKTAVTFNYTQAMYDKGYTLFIISMSDYQPLSIDEINNMDIQLELGSTATDYEPYKSQVVTFPLAEGQKLMLGDYLADDGIHHKRKQIVLDGTEGYINQAQGVDSIFYTAFKVQDMRENSELLCSHFRNSKNIEDVKMNIGIGALYENYIYFGIDVETIGATADMTLAQKTEKWKSYLAEQKANGTPIVIEYYLAEEEIEPYTTEQREAYNKIKELYSYKGTTHITCENEVSCIFQTGYYKDLETILNNMQAQILAE